MGILALLILYTTGASDAESMYKSMTRIWDPLVEAAIVLLILVDWIIIIHPLLGHSLGLSFLGSIVFVFAIPYLLIVRYFGYSHQSIGIRMSRSDVDRSVMAICSILIISRLVMLLFSPKGFSVLFSNGGSILVGILYLGFVVGFVEEFVFRGIIQNRIAFHFRSRVLGIILTSSMFAALHVVSVMTGLVPTPMNVGSSLVYAFMTRLPLGLILGMVWNKSESLKGVTLIHASNNIAFVLQSLAGL